MQGYYKRPEETAEVIRDGWLHTGDLGYLDAAGLLHITGRKKEIIVLPNGKNINPTEIEGKLAGMADGISEVAVFLHQEGLHAAMVPDIKRLRELNIADVAAHLRNDVLARYNRAVTPYKKIMKLHLLKQELPKTRLGKLKRFLLADLVAEDRSEQARGPEPDFAEYLAIRQFVQEQKTDVEVYADAHLELDLGFDSLDLVGLQSFLEGTFGIDVTEQALADHPSLRHLAEQVRENKTRNSVAALDWAEILGQRSKLDLPRSWAVHNLFRHILTLPLRGYFRLSATGQHNLPTGPCILAPNHQSFLDGLFVAAFLDNAAITRTYFFAKAKHVDKPWLRYLAARNNVIVFDLEHDLKHALQNLAEVLRQGCNLIVFPEGTRTKDGDMAPFRKTYAILSRELGVPVVPVAIDGAWDALPTGARLPKPLAPIRVSFLEQIEPGEQTYDALNEAVMSRVRGALG
jgi:long-chain acyl-CoA synthetase